MRDHLSSLQKVSSQLGIKLRPLGSPNRFVIVDSLGIPNLDDDYNTNPIPRRPSSRQSQFPCNFDLILIKIDQF